MVADALLIGTFVLLFNQPQLVPLFQTMSGGVVCIVAGLLLCGIGSYYYMDAGFGCGPRDALMVAIYRHFPQVPAGVARFFLEGSAFYISLAIRSRTVNLKWTSWKPS